MLTDLNPPPAEPITLAEAKAFLRVDHDDEDALIQTLIASARERLETHLNIAMITRQMRFSTATKGTVRLPRWPVASVQTVRFDDEETVEAVVNLRCRPAPVTYRVADLADVTFTAGYGLDPQDVLAPLRQAILLLIAQGFEHRDGAPSSLPLMVDALTMPYRGMGL
jgi:uncharacterized phiE125 gp8 family phage protein